MGEIYTAIEAFNSKKVNNRNRYIIKYYPIRQYCILFFDLDVFIVHIFDMPPLYVELCLVLRRSGQVTLTLRIVTKNEIYIKAKLQ